MASLDGMRLRLRLMMADDAAYVHALRTNPSYNRYLSPVTGTVADQSQWIVRYKEREARGEEFYYVIERLTDGGPCGLVRLYDVADQSFTWGSWILDQSKPPKAALESAVLSFRLGFQGLGATLARIDVRKENVTADAFYRRFGMTQISEDRQDYYFEYPRVRFEQDEPEYMMLLQEEGDR